jgi:hypothetical protein
MKAQAVDLPGALKGVCNSVGLHFLAHITEPSLRYPIAAANLPTPDTIERFATLPIQANFTAAVLDMDKAEDLAEYQNIMVYAASNYGMRIVNLERKYITKTTRTDGRRVKRLVKRIYIEYYAPYRVIPANMEF